MNGSAAGPEDLRYNRLLAALPEAERERLLPHLERVELNLSDPLYEPGKRIDSMWFPGLGVCSIVAELEGLGVEVATVGEEGMVGLPVFLGVGIPTERAVCQVAGWALRMDADRFREELAIVDGVLQHIMQRYTETMFTQLARNAACNRTHRTRERCARWLLMTADRMHSERFELTQKFLAQMLAVRRSSVSEVAGALAEEGCISYRRGVITVLDRKGLEARACGCYAALREVVDAAFPPGPERGR